MIYQDFYFTLGSFSNKLNVNLMNLSSYFKFFYHCQLLKPIKTHTIHINRNNIVQVED